MTILKYITKKVFNYLLVRNILTGLETNQNV